jgi:hypothetical protein
MKILRLLIVKERKIKKLKEITQLLIMKQVAIKLVTLQKVLDWMTTLILRTGEHPKRNVAAQYFEICLVSI